MVKKHVDEKTGKRSREKCIYQADEVDDTLADHDWGEDAEADIAVDDIAESMPVGDDVYKANIVVNMAARRQIEVNRENKRLKDLTEDDLFGDYDYDVPPRRKRPVAMREKTRTVNSSRRGALQRRSTSKVS